MALYPQPRCPLREVLYGMTGKSPPVFVDDDIFFLDQLTSEQMDELQSWAVRAVRPQWLTGIAMLESAETQIYEAISNGNIEGPK